MIGQRLLLSYDDCGLWAGAFFMGIDLQQADRKAFGVACIKFWTFRYEKAVVKTVRACPLGLDEMRSKHG